MRGIHFQPQIHLHCLQTLSSSVNILKWMFLDKSSLTDQDKRLKISSDELPGSRRFLDQGCKSTERFSCVTSWSGPCWGLLPRLKVSKYLVNILLSKVLVIIIVDLKHRSVYACPQALNLKQIMINNLKSNSKTVFLFLDQVFILFKGSTIPALPAAPFH